MLTHSNSSSHLREPSFVSHEVQKTGSVDGHFILPSFKSLLSLSFCMFASRCYIASRENTHLSFEEKGGNRQWVCARVSQILESSAQAGLGWGRRRWEWAAGGRGGGGVTQCKYFRMGMVNKTVYVCERDTKEKIMV